MRNTSNGCRKETLMQRDKIKTTYPVVKEYRSFMFWRECRFCGKEFKRENGFKIIDLKMCRRSDEDPIFISYCCSKCGQNIDDVINKVDMQAHPLKYFNNINPPKGSGIKDTSRLDEIFKRE